MVPFLSALFLLFSLIKSRQTVCCHDLGVCDYRQGVDLILDLLTLLGTVSYYSTTANLDRLQITAVNTKTSPARNVFSRRSLATSSNSGDSSGSRTQILPSPTLVQNCLPAGPSTELDRHSPPLFYNNFARTE
jgi:hypothetical protein